MAITDCSKCGHKLRIETEQVGMDKNELPIIHRIGYCDNCMTKTDLDAYSTEPNNKKNSTLSIWALVLSLFGCTLFIGFILALVDLCQNDKSKKHTGSWFSVIFTIFFLIVGIAVGVTSEPEQPKEQNVSKIEYSESNNDNEIDSKDETDIEIETDSISEEKFNYATVGETVTGKEWKISLLDAKQYDCIESEYYTSYPEVDGNKYLILYFEVENISNKDNHFNMFYMESYCDGYAIDQTFILNEPNNYNALGGDVGTGKKLKGYIAYEVNPDWTEFEYSYKDWIGNSDKVATFLIKSEQLN